MCVFVQLCVGIHARWKGDNVIERQRKGCAVVASGRFTSRDQGFKAKFGPHRLPSAAQTTVDSLLGAFEFGEL